MLIDFINHEPRETVCSWTSDLVPRVGETVWLGKTPYDVTHVHWLDTMRARVFARAWGSKS